MTESGRIFYRIIRSREATPDDFKSAKALGKPLRDPSQVRAWEHGVSVFDSLDYARERARGFRFLLGRWVVALRIPDDGSIEIARTGHDQHHFTIYATPEQLLSLIAGVTMDVED